MGEARLPGRGPGPPPAIAGVEAVWWGARKGGRWTSGWPGGSSPATEWIRVTSSACSSVSGGRRPGRRRASIVLPVPGGRRGGGCGVRPRRSRERAARAPWPAHVAEVGTAAARAAAERLHGRTVDHTAQVCRRLGQMAHRNRLDPGEAQPRRPTRRRKRGDAARARRAASAATRRPARAARARRARARRPPRVLQTLRRHLARRAEERERDREVEAGSSLRRPAGASSPVIRRSGHSCSALAMPLRTRSFASWHALSGSPTMEKPGTPRWRCASTSTRAGIEADERMRERACEHLHELGRAKPHRGALSAAIGSANGHLSDHREQTRPARVRRPRHPADLRRRILDAGRIAGSAQNRQPWRFFVLESRDVSDRVAQTVYVADNMLEPSSWSPSSQRGVRLRRRPRGAEHDARGVERGRDVVPERDARNPDATAELLGVGEDESVVNDPRSAIRRSLATRNRAAEEWIDAPSANPARRSSSWV